MLLVGVGFVQPSDRAVQAGLLDDVVEVSVDQLGRRDQREGPALHVADVVRGSRVVVVGTVGTSETPGNQVFDRDGPDVQKGPPTHHTQAIPLLQ